MELHELVERYDVNWFLTGERERREGNMVLVLNGISDIGASVRKSRLFDLFEAFG